MKIVFSGGGTLGSVTPLLALAEIIKEQNPEVEFFWLGTKDGPEKLLVDKAGIKFIALSSGKWRRYFSFLNFLDLFKIFAGWAQAVATLNDIRPQVIVMAGGYVGVPVGWAANILHIPFIIHQQDLRLSLSNKLLKSFAIAITVNWPELAKLFPTKKVTVVGNPVRKFIFSQTDKGDIYKKYNLTPTLPVILAVGGGTGAEFINHLMADSYDGLKDDFQVVNLVGQNYDESFSANGFHTIKFGVEEVPELLKIADLVVSRAGLGFITELAALGKPAVIIPIPNSHQEDNAEYLLKHQAAVVLDQSTLVSADFTKKIREIYSNKETLSDLSKNINLLYDVNSGQKFADLVLQIANKYGSK